MSVFFRFLATLIANMLWQRAGGRGGIPPVRLPRSGKSVNVPTLGPWQMMVAMWLFNKFWHQYGGRVKTHLMDMQHTVPRRVGSWLPDSPNVAQSKQNSAGKAANTPAAVVDPTAPSYQTQRLDDAPAATAQNSMFGSLQPGTPSS